MNLDNNAPLVSVLIPAYNRPHFLKIALESALNQTYRNIEIIICDDSTNYEVKNMIQPYLEMHANLKYFNNAETVGRHPGENFSRCFSLASGEYINFLNDDDVFYPKKIERMVEFLKDEEITIVTSRRSLIDKDGNVLPDVSYSKPISTIDRVYDGKEIARRMILKSSNFIGEPTTVLFRKKDIDQLGVFMGRRYRCNHDMATWATLLLKGKFVYISEILSSFRVHPGQESLKSNIHQMASRELKYLLEDGVKAGIITNSELELTNSRKK